MKVVSPSPAPENAKPTSAAAGTPSAPHPDGTRPISAMTTKNTEACRVLRSTAHVSSPRSTSVTSSGEASMPS